jgi:hypothetical protein
MPRQLAADRYSPEIAPAFHHVDADCDATNRSDVVRATRTPATLRPAATSTTAATSASPRQLLRS